MKHMCKQLKAQHTKAYSNYELDHAVALNNMLTLFSFNESTRGGITINFELPYLLNRRRN